MQPGRREDAMQSEPATADDLPSVLHHACAEMRRRLLAGEDCQAEQFLAAHPALASNPDTTLAVIRAEWLARHDAGRQLAPRTMAQAVPCLERPVRRLVRREHSAARQHGRRRRHRTGGRPRHGSARPGAVPEPSPPARADWPGRYGHCLPRLGSVLKRHVALKKIRAGVLADEGEVERFYRECAGGSELRHPNVVPIYGLGLHQERTASP